MPIEDRKSLGAWGRAKLAKGAEREIGDGEFFVHFVLPLEMAGVKFLSASLSFPSKCKQFLSCQNGRRQVFWPQAAARRGVGFGGGKEFCRVFFHLERIVGIGLGFFIGFALVSYALLLEESRLVERDGKIWRFPVFEIELLQRRIVPNIWDKEAECTAEPQDFGERIVL